MTKKEAILSIKKIRKAQRKHFDKAVFCNDHNMPLQKLFHVEIEKELGQLAIELEIILKTGYVSDL